MWQCPPVLQQPNIKPDKPRFQAMIRLSNTSRCPHFNKPRGLERSSKWARPTSLSKKSALGATVKSSSPVTSIRENLLRLRKLTKCSMSCRMPSASWEKSWFWENCQDIAISSSFTTSLSLKTTKILVAYTWCSKLLRLTCAKYTDLEILWWQSRTLRQFCIIYYAVLNGFTRQVWCIVTSNLQMCSFNGIAPSKYVISDLQDS